MTIHKFPSGSVLYTGQDMRDVLDKANKRNDYSTECSYCLHDGKDDDFCSDCSLLSGDMGCSCHIMPPCAKCTDSRFEVTPYLINYKHFKDGKSPWECYRADEKTFKKFELIEAEGFYANAETLTTGDVALYLTKGEYDEIEICRKVEFKNRMSKLINDFNISSALQAEKELSD